MMYLAFAIFFALNFSLWFIFPALILKAITKTSKKKKNKNIKNYYIVYSAFTGIYVLVYLMFFRYFSVAINNLNSEGEIGYFYDGIGNLALILIFFMIISIIQVIFTFYLAKKLFKIKEFNKGYVFISITGFLNVITYFFTNSVLNLGMYSFAADMYLLNLIMKLDNEILLFLFPFLVFINFALSFVEEK